MSSPFLDQDRLWCMHDVTFYRIDAAKNMKRFYRLDLQPGLFGLWPLLKGMGANRTARSGTYNIFPRPRRNAASIRQAA
jgi:hypothetical protein